MASFNHRLIQALSRAYDARFDFKIDFDEVSEEESHLLLMINAVLNRTHDALKTAQDEAEALRRTRRRAVETALRFEQATATARILTWDCDQEGRVRYLSPSAKDLLGKRSDQLIGGRTLDQLLHPERAPLFASYFSREEGFSNLEERFRHFDGRTLWFSTSGIPIRDEEGVLQGFYGVCLDITARKQAELERAVNLSLLEKGRSSTSLGDFFQGALEVLREFIECDAMVLRTGSGEGEISASHGIDEVELRKCLKASPTSTSCFPIVDAPSVGLSERGNFWSNAIEDLEGSEHLPQAFLKVTKGFASTGLVRLTIGGETQGLLLLCDREPGRFQRERVGFIERIADQLALAISKEHVKHQVAERERQLGLIMSQVSDLIWRMDLMGTFSFASDRVYKTLGYPKGMPIRLQQILTPESYTLLQTRIREAFQSRDTRPQVVEVEVVSVKNEVRTMELSCMIAYEVGEQTASVIVIARDITERKQRELESLQNLKLESMGRLASGIAHEINTPIQFINDSIYFLKESFEDMGVLRGQYEALAEACEGQGKFAPLLEEVEDCVDDIDLEFLEEQVPKSLDRCVDGLTRVAKIVKAMKEFASPSRTGICALDVNAVIENTLEVATNEYKYVAKLNADLGQVAPVEAHPGELGQVFLNLLINAAMAVKDVVEDSGEQGEIEVTSRQDGDFILVSIRDTGGGIPDHVVDKIFDPFFTTRAVGEGQGQGLATARYIIVDKLGGRLTFDTNVGVGTTFTVWLKAKE